MTITSSLGPDGYTVSIPAPVSGAGIPFANLPSAASAGGGYIARVSDFGKLVTLESDGAYWRPRHGQQRLYGQNGSISAPLATLTGVTSGQFTLPETLTLPAGLIAPNSEVWGEFVVYRVGATATGLVQWRLGTSGTVADSVVYQATMASTTANTSRMIAEARFGAAAARFFAPLAAAFGGGGSTATGADRTTNVNTAAAMSVTCDLASANAADTFHLVGYDLWLKG